MSFSHRRKLVPMIDCPECDGDGDGDDNCTRCGGTGRIRQQEPDMPSMEPDMPSMDINLNDRYETVSGRQVKLTIVDTNDVYGFISLGATWNPVMWDRRSGGVIELYGNVEKETFDDLRLIPYGINRGVSITIWILNDGNTQTFSAPAKKMPKRPSNFFAEIKLNGAIQRGQSKSFTCNPDSDGI